MEKVNSGNNEEYSFTLSPEEKYNLELFASKQSFTNTWQDKYLDSDGLNAGQGNKLLDQAELINGTNYRKFVYYYNPIDITNSGKYDDKISSIFSTQCVAFLDGGVVVMISPVGGSDGSNGCQFVKDSNLKLNL